MIELFCTDDYAVAERADIWHHILSTAFVPFEVPVLGTETVFGEIRTATYGALEASDVRSGPQVVRRSRRLVEETEGDYYKLGLQLSGYCVVTQDDREAALTPGDFALYDCSRPFQLAFDDSFRMLAFMFPRRLLRLPPAAVGPSLARRISGRKGLGALLTPLLASMVELTDELPASAAEHIADSVLDLLVAVFTEQTGTMPEDADPLRRSLLLRIKAFIEVRLGDPELTPEVIAAAHHISTRYLHKLHETEGISVARYIRQRRLEHCRRDLGDPHQAHVQVAVIAARWGFTDAGNFSNTFRSTYEMSPREYRAQVHSG